MFAQPNILGRNITTFISPSEKRKSFEYFSTVY